MGSVERARTEGESAIAALRTRLNNRVNALIKQHPEFAAGAAEVGLVDRAWLDDPDRPLRTATPLDVVKRFLERSVENEPSIIASLGLNAIELLTIEGDLTDTEGTIPHELSIVFTDLEGFTGFTARAGDEAARDLLDAHHRAVGPVVRSRGGRIVKRIGDGLLISFAAPEAAVLAALEIRESEDGPLRLRAGVHHGEAYSLRDDLVGHDVNLTARIADSARGGEILATTQVRDAVDGLPSVRFGRARRRSFKGVEVAVAVCPVERP